MSSVLRAVTPRPQAVLLTEDDRARERGYRGPMARELGRRFLPGARTWDRHQVVDVLVAVVFGVAGEVEALEIGRASCRERV